MADDPNQEKKRRIRQAAIRHRSFFTPYATKMWDDLDERFKKAWLRVADDSESRVGQRIQKTVEQIEKELANAGMAKAAKYVRDEWLKKMCNQNRKAP